MSEPVRLYEGLFLLNQQAIASEFAAVVEHVRQVITRGGAELDVLRKWDERRLAYPVRGQKRGVYLLAYFRAPVSEIARMERDFNLSEQVLRSMIIRADHVGETELELVRKDADLTLEVKLRSGGPETPSTQDESAASRMQSAAAGGDDA